MKQKTKHKVHQRHFSAIFMLLDRETLYRVTEEDDQCTSLNFPTMSFDF